MTTREHDLFPEPIVVRLLLRGKRVVRPEIAAEALVKLASLMLPFGETIRQASGGVVEALTEGIVVKSVEALAEQMVGKDEPIRVSAYMLLLVGETRVALYQSDRQYTLGEQILLLPKSEVAAFEVQKAGVIWHGLFIRLANGTELHCQVHRTALERAEKMRALLPSGQPGP